MFTNWNFGKFTNLILTKISRFKVYCEHIIITQKQSIACSVDSLACVGLVMVLHNLTEEPVIQAYKIEISKNS